MIQKMYLMCTFFFYIQANTFSFLHPFFLHIGQNQGCHLLPQRGASTLEEEEDEDDDENDADDVYEDDEEDDEEDEDEDEEEEEE